MKLRNKKTGEIMDLSEGFIKGTYYGEFIQIKPVAISNKEGYLYGSLAELNAEWEDYKPAEPLIKDEKIRKAVRAWAEANEITQVSYDAGWNAFRCTDFVVDFDYDFDRHDGLKDMESYTIAELCGEEE